VTNPEPYITPAEVGKLLSIPESTLARWRWTHDGPPAYQIGKRPRYLSSEVLAWANAQRQPNAADHPPRDIAEKNTQRVAS